MRTIKKISNKILLHPVMTFLLLTAITIVISGVLDLFDTSITYTKINAKTGNYESTLVTVESLLSLSGIKYIFSNTASNFASFAPLIILLISLLGIGIMDKTGFLDSIFFLITNSMPKVILTFLISLICILSTITGDLSFVIMIPLVALLFKYAKRNPLLGMIMAFASLATGYGINLFLSSVDVSLVEFTELAARTITGGYSISSAAYLYVMTFAAIIGAIIITYITEKIMVLKVGKYQIEEEIIDKEALTRREKKGLVYATIGCGIYILIFIYNIIPNVPLGGNFLDYSQVRYIEKLFAPNAFFNSGFVFIITFLFVLAGLLYGLGAKTLDNHRDICDAISYSLDGVGKILVFEFFASMFISLFKYTNIGSLITATFANLIDSFDFTGIPLIIILFVISIITTLFVPNMVTRWQILSATVVPKMMVAGFTPEFAQLIFVSGSSCVYGITPVMAYFVIYLAYMEKYDKEGMGLIKGIRYILPYVLGMIIMWLLLLLLWYLVGLPLGIKTASIL